ncbi:dicarboxylate/amino acid:cation symporter [Lentibacillus sediminis]|uniref:dicarboxylate/amino acid:cation symporter n=1 Tax=Lentibacillus sediminis TaxID=1940529 RepID=UPI000C1BA702|nr:dicarboxylate/amino acid:cation symporter [Lentibacillus sediminis]
MKKIWRGYLDASLILKITIALILGVITGLIFGEDAAALAPLGDLLIRLLNFLIVPLILFTLIVGINQTRPGQLGRMGGKIILYYLASTAMAIIVGLAISSIFNPGSGVQLNTDQQLDQPENPGMVSVLLNIVPDNIVTAMSELNLMGLIFTALVFGLAISVLRSRTDYQKTGDLLYNVFDGLNEATLTIMKGFLQYIPIGIFAIIADTVGSQGTDTIVSLGHMLMVFYIAILAQLGFYILVMVLFKISPREFFRSARTPMLTAFVTQSSSGTLPLTLDAARNLGLSKSLYGFSLPLGATINMDGAAIRIAVSAAFAANMIGDPLSFTAMLQVVLVGTLASVGTAGIPGAGIVMIATVFVQVGLPLEIAALLTAVDALIGMGATCLNITGDLTGTSIVNKTEKGKKQAV